MNKFPEPIQIPDFIEQERNKRNRELSYSSKKGIIIRSLVIALELFGVALYDSSALLMDAVASLVDVGSSLFLLICIKLAARPPDRDHPFGHGRFEPLAGFQLGALLVLTGILTLIWHGINFEQEVQRPPLSSNTWIIPLIAMIFLEFSYWQLIRTAKKQNSPALIADAFHYRLDSLTSFFAMVVLIIGAFYPKISPFADYAGAILISIFMIISGLYATKENLNQLLDKTPDSDYFKIVRTAALKASGVLGVEKTRIQYYGPDAHIDIDIEVDPHLTVEAAHRISQEVRAEIQKHWPAVRDVMVHLEPYYPNDH